jgi:hypothetical protein
MRTYPVRPIRRWRGCPFLKPGMSASGRPPGTVAGSTTTGRDWLLRLNPQHFEPVRAVFVSTTTAASPIQRWLKPPEPTCSPFAPAWGEARVQRRDQVFAPYRHSEGRAWSSPKVSTVCRPAKAPALRKPAARRRHGLQNDHHYVAAMDAGTIFGFSLKKLSVSYCALISLMMSLGESGISEKETYGPVYSNLPIRDDLPEYSKLISGSVSLRMRERRTAAVPA